MILDKYKIKRKIGRGAYGEVVLVSDPSGQQMAIKMVSKKIIHLNPQLQQYLEGQKEAMMSVKNSHVVELYSFEEDENFYYYVCEYCNGGDLLNYQAKQPNKVFTLKQATEILSQIIEGLQILHQKGYLHRDIKPANILLKKKNEADKFEFKLADFGFAEKNSEVEVGGTILGPQVYMSPEILYNQIYSYEVDMWAFGVLFYFMLNMEYPFMLNPHVPIKSKQQDLIKQATDFSYQENVKKSKKKLLDNCTSDVEDLFLKMFDLNPQKRITFSQIKKHQLFKQYFPANQNHEEKKNGILSNLHQSKYCPSRQKSLLQAKYDKILFLQFVSNEFSGSLNFIDDALITALKQNLLKYHIMLLRNFYGSLKPQILQKTHPGLNWKQHSTTPQFLTLKNKVQKKLEGVLLVFEKQETCNDFSGAFKHSYRSSTTNVYKILRQKLSHGNKFVYLAALIVMCHAFNNLINCDDEQLEGIFSDFAQERKNKDYISFIELKNWIQTSTKQKVKTVIKNILSKFFSA